MMRCAAVCVTHDFAPGDTCVGKAAAQHKPAGWVHQRFEICVQAIRCRSLFHGVAHRLLDLPGMCARTVLCADEERVDPPSVVIKCDLCLSVRQQ